MPTTEVPPNEWSLFFDSFSLRHEGWLVNLEVLDLADSPLKDEASALPLEGISADEKDGENIISISIGEDGRNRLRHEIESPTSVRLVQTDDGADKALEITSRSGRTLLEFRIPARLDTLDEYIA